MGRGEDWRWARTRLYGPSGEKYGAVFCDDHSAKMLIESSHEENVG